MPSEPIPSLDDDPTPSDRQLLRKAAGALLGVLVLSGLLVLLVTASQHDPRLRHAPLTLVGAPSATASTTRALAAEPGQQYDVRTSTTFGPAKADLRSREVKAVLVLRPSGSEKLYVASAAGDPVARMIRMGFEASAQQAGTKLTVSDIATLPKGDSAGNATFGLALALAIGGLLGAVALFFVARTVPFVVRVLVLAVYCLALGALAAYLTDEVLDALTGHFLSLWLISSATAGAVAFATQGLQAAVGAPGTALATVTLLVLSNTSSGGSSIPETLPDPLRQIGPYLPAANAIDALRGELYFAGDGIGHPLLVLACFGAGGILLGLIGNLLFGRQRRGKVAPLGEA